MAALPNVTIKQVRPFMAEAVELFSADRSTFARDALTDALFAPFAHTMGADHILAAAFSQDEQRDMFGRNANRIYRLGPDLENRQ